MRLIKLSQLRRYRPSPTTQLHHFVCQYSSSSSRSPITSSTHNHRDGWRNYNLGCSWELLRHSPPDLLSFSRRFSAEPGVEPDEPLLPVSAPEMEEPFIAVKALISLLDCYHDATGFPWWIVISTSAVTMRLALFPISVVQLKKMKLLGKLLPKLMRYSRTKKSLMDQYDSFWKEKKAAGCPSLFWYISSLVIQVPWFFLWIFSVRLMCLNHHPGFDSGGTLWFQNLTEFPQGALGPIFPFCIAGLQFIIVQLSFEKTGLDKLPDALGSLGKGFKTCLQILALPMLITAFNIPQGSLVYWITNSTMTLIQQSCLRNPAILSYLGVPNVNTRDETLTDEKKGSSRVANIVVRTKEGDVNTQSLSPVELVNLSVIILSKGRKDDAIRLLRLALDKDLGCVSAMLTMGQTLLKDKQHAEAAECFENAISKLLADGYPTEVEDVDHLILTSQWAGVANVRQGKMEEGLVHLERIAQLKEPEDPKSKAHYYDGLIVLSRYVIDDLSTHRMNFHEPKKSVASLRTHLSKWPHSSTLTVVGRGEEALEYLQKAAAYDPANSVYIQQLEEELKNPSNDQSNKMK